MKRRDFIRIGGATGLAAFASNQFRPVQRLFASIPGGSLDPSSIPKFVSPLVKPPVFRPDQKLKNGDSYAIAVRQFQQQILPFSLPQTPVWSYGPADSRATDLAHRFFYPAFTFEATWRRTTSVRWVNGLVDSEGAPLPHLLPVDPTLHWANPIGDRDGHPPHEETDPYWSNPLIDADGRYVGPVPIVTHLHGADTFQESDGYPEAWFLPDGRRGSRTLRGRLCEAGVHWTRGTYFDRYNPGNGGFGPGFATFEYPNNQRATTLWYHDHALGMTRLNVYAGPAGFYLIRGGPDDEVRDRRDNTRARLPGPAPDQRLNPFGTFYEIPIVIQDRSFNADGSLFFPAERAFFEGLSKAELNIPFFPAPACDGMASDISPIWNPEFFGNTIVVNGQTWPYLDVEQRRYRFRVLNGCGSRFLWLDFSQVPNVEVWQIGADGGFLAAPVNISADRENRMLVAMAERSDIIVDFTNVPQGDYVLRNIGPDEPFGGGLPGVDFDPSDENTTGNVMMFRVGPALSADSSTPPRFLKLPSIERLRPSVERQVSLNEESSRVITFVDDGTSIQFGCGDGQEPFGPQSALLGTLNEDGSGHPRQWMDGITESPTLNTCEEWEIHNFTEDAHPIHVHLVQFQVVGREPMGGGTSAAGSNGPLPAETGFKDTVVAYPDEITRIKARFHREGRYVWHCHVLEHEDNEMMRPYEVVKRAHPDEPPYHHRKPNEHHQRHTMRHGRWRRHRSPR